MARWTYRGRRRRLPFVPLDRKTAAWLAGATVAAVVTLSVAVWPSLSDHGALGPPASLPSRGDQRTPAPLVQSTLPEQPAPDARLSPPPSASDAPAAYDAAATRDARPPVRNTLTPSPSDCASMIQRWRGGGFQMPPYSAACSSTASGGFGNGFGRDGNGFGFTGR
jgi:hypothetical protein